MDDDYKLYLLSELRYKEDNKDKTEEEIFPGDWYSSKDYNFKTKIILEAMKNNILIKETKLYKEFQEHVN